MTPYNKVALQLKIARFRRNLVSLPVILISGFASFMDVLSNHPVSLMFNLSILGLGLLSFTFATMHVIQLKSDLADLTIVDSDSRSK